MTIASQIKAFSETFAGAAKLRSFGGNDITHTVLDFRDAIMKDVATEKNVSETFGSLDGVVNEITTLYNTNVEDAGKYADILKKWTTEHFAPKTTSSKSTESKETKDDAGTR